MQSASLEVALEREHREIDEGIEAFTTASADGADAATLAARAATLSRTIEALRRHIYLEEEFLFPAMRVGFAIPIGVMLREHGEIWRTLDVLQAQLAEGGAAASISETCEELMSQLDWHNAKEEPIFYTHADRSLSPAQSAELKTLLDSGQMPAGWVCQAAAS